MTQYRMLSDRAVRDFRTWVLRNPDLISMPPTATEWSSDPSGAHDTMPAALKRHLARVPASMRSNPSFQKGLREGLRHLANDQLDMVDRVHPDRSLDEEPHAILRSFLASRGLGEDEIDRACALLDGNLGADDPPDFGGMPVPGGRITPLKNNSPASLRGSAPGAQDARRLAMDNVMRIQSDYVAPPRPPSLDCSDRTLSSFAKRWPEVARIKQA